MKTKPMARAGAKQRGCVMYSVDIGTEGEMHFKFCDIFVVGYILLRYIWLGYIWLISEQKERATE